MTFLATEHRLVGGISSRSAVLTIPETRWTPKLAIALARLTHQGQPRVQLYVGVSLHRGEQMRSYACAMRDTAGTWTRSARLGGAR